jgi:hypothetical protein
VPRLVAGVPEVYKAYSKVQKVLQYLLKQQKDEMTQYEFTEEPSVTTYDIFQEVRPNTNRRNRVLMDLKKPVGPDQVAYYCNGTPHHAAIHRGDFTGPVIATTDSSEGKDGLTEIHMAEAGSTIPIRHKHETIPHTHGSSFFTVGGKHYYWRKRHDLIEEGTNNVLAAFHPARGSTHQGTLYIFPSAEHMKDIVVISALMDQERVDDKKKAKVSWLGWRV